MNILFLSILILITNFNVEAEQSARCEYGLNSESEKYQCELTIEDAIEDKNVTNISGRHSDGKNDDDVQMIRKIYRFGISWFTFPTVICQKFKNLEVIELSGVYVENIVENSFDDCTKLETLSLHYGKILHLPEDIFSCNSKLNELTLYGNDIEKLPEGVFDSLINLDSLSLSSNKIKSLNSNFFEYLVNLKKLDLAFNDIAEMCDEIFDPLVNLESLRFGFNEVPVINPKWFRNLKKLKILYWNLNGVEDLQRNIFAPLVSLEELWIQQNKLTTIHLDSFGEHPNLKIFEFHSNDLYSIDKKIFEKFTTLTRVYGEANNCVIRTGWNEGFTVEKSLKRCIENYVERKNEIRTTTIKSISCKSTLNSDENIKIAKKCPTMAMQDEMTTKSNVNLSKSKGSQMNFGTYNLLLIFIIFLYH